MRIVITTFGSLGDLHPYLNIAEHLTAAGHGVTIATNSQHRERVEAEGLSFRPMRPDIVADPQFFRQVMDEFRGGRFLVRDLLVPAIRDSYADLLAAVPSHDLLVTHMATFAGPLVARATGIPWVSTVLAPLSFFSASDPPVLVAGAMALREHAKPLANLLNRFALRRAQSFVRPLRRFQRELGQPDAGDPLHKGQHSPQSVLALFSRHFAAPQADWPSQTTVAGFPLRAPAALPPAIERFLSNGPPPVVFTLGSSAVFTPGSFYQSARALGKRVLLLAGPEAAAISLSTDVLAVDYAPHSAIFPHASAIVHQGGIGTVAEVLRSGRPSLVVPFSHDQPDNAARLRRLRVARVLTRRALNAKTLRTELDLLLNDPDYAANAQALAQRIRLENGSQNAARLFEATFPSKSLS